MKVGRVNLDLSKDRLSTIGWIGLKELEDQFEAGRRFGPGV